MSLVEFINVFKDVEADKVGIVFGFSSTGEMICKRYNQFKNNETRIISDDKYIFNIEELFGEFYSSVSHELFLIALKGLLEQASLALKKQSELNNKLLEENSNLKKENSVLLDENRFFSEKYLLSLGWGND